MKNTVAKTQIKELIESSSVALSPNEIKKIVKKVCSKVTVYRILDRLVDEEFIHKVMTPEGGVKYAATSKYCENYKPNHVHFSCKKCNRITCLKHIEATCKLHKAYEVEEVYCTIVGVCPRCKK
ncbi:transcriptional repressor [Bernardetia sp. Wsw4-3y2]|uniref:Fur family transcriptional regulator n=1 Tax=Bernardetia sp. Wsw4-3y2 TaxID=3127471 RepID=UPI0030CB0910